MKEALLIDCQYNVAIGSKPLDDIPTHFTAHVPALCLIIDNFLLPIDTLLDSESLLWSSDCQISVNKVVVVYCPSDNVRMQTIQHALWVPVKVCSSTAVFLLIYH